MAERYRYSGGEFIRFGNNFEEWQGGQARYHFTKIHHDQNWLYLVDHSDPVRSISIKLPYNHGMPKGGMSYIKWAGNWDDGLPWIDFHPMTVLHKNAPEPMFQLNSPTFRSAGRYTKARAQSLARTSGVLQTEPSPGVWNCFASGTLIHGVVVLTGAHVLENMRTKFPSIQDTDIAVTFNYDYTAATADRKPKGDLNPNRPWARVRRVLEEGSSLGLDYALLLVRWEPQWAPNPVTVTSPLANRASTMGENVLAIQHPGYFKIGDHVDGKALNHRLYENPTQVSAGNVYDLLQAPHETYGGGKVHALEASGLLTG